MLKKYKEQLICEEVKNCNTLLLNKLMLVFEVNKLLIQSNRA